MRVLHISQGAADGGAERAIRDIISACRRMGVESFAAAPPGPFDFDVQTFELAPLARKLRKLPAAISSITKAIRRSGPDLIHFHSIGYFLAFRLARLWGRIPCVLGLHGLPEHDYARVAKLIKLLSRSTIAYGPGTSSILWRYEIPNELIYYGISPAPEPMSRDELVRIAEVGPGQAIVLAAGRLVEQKNHKVLVAALPLLPNVKLVIAGDGELREALQRQARELGVSDRLKLLGFRSDVRAHMAAADVIAMPSTWEGFGLVVAEAMLAGRPIVAAEAPGLKEWIVDGKNGALFPPNDPQQAARVIERILTDSALRQRISSTAKEFAQDLTFERLASHHLKVYSRALNTRSKQIAPAVF